MKKVLVLGGAGFIGSNLVERLIDADKKVIVFDREKAHWKNIEPFIDKIEIIKDDFNNFKILEQIFRENKIDTVIHLVSSAIPSTQLDGFIQNNELVFTMKLVDIMIKNKVSKIVYFSSGGAVYGANGEEKNKEDSPTKPITLYGWLKVTLENYIQMCAQIYGLDYIILRVSNPYGKNQNIFGKLGLISVVIGKILRGEPMEIWGDGNVVRDYICIDDVSKATLMLIENNKWGGVYNIGSGKGSTVNEILKTLKKITANDCKVIYKKSRTVDISTNILDISKLKNDLPSLRLTSLNEGIKKYWESLKDNH